MSYHRPRLVAAALALAACGVVGCAAPGSSSRGAPTATRAAPAGDPGEPAFSLVVGTGVTPAQAARVAELVSRGVQRVRKTFGVPFRARFEVHVFGSRADLDAFWRGLWNKPGFSSQCWMVASGRATTMALLLPDVWGEQACEHDPGDAAHVQNLVTHELVHVFHDQHNPVDAFEGFEPIAWFVEGLATLVSGQLEEGRLAPAVEAVCLDRDPATLAEAHRGRYRYGVSGSLVRYVARRVGRDGLRELLAATDQAGILARVGQSEQELLEAWRQGLLAVTPAPDAAPGPAAEPGRP